MIKVKTSDAKRTLNQWKETYFETRAKIEASGRDARWEFDRKRLFERTDYMATICEDIHEVAQVSYNIHFFIRGFRWIWNFIRVKTGLKWALERPF